MKEPTAKQLVELVQAIEENPLNVAPGGLGLATTVQEVPSQCSTSVRWISGIVKNSPTATQLVALVHETPVNWLRCAPGEFGLATMLQLLPFHCSTKVRPIPDPGMKRPTATQRVEPAHDTSNNSVDAAVAGFGLATIVHELPFHRSMSVRGCGVLGVV